MATFNETPNSRTINTLARRFRSMRDNSYRRSFGVLIHADRGLFWVGDHPERVTAIEAAMEVEYQIRRRLAA